MRKNHGDIDLVDLLSCALPCNAFSPPVNVRAVRENSCLLPSKGKRRTKIKAETQRIKTDKTATMRRRPFKAVLLPREAHLRERTCRAAALVAASMLCV